MFFAFRTKKKRPMDRDNWKKFLNLSNNKNHLWNPDTRVCSLHYFDGKPTPVNPNKTLAMRYNTDKRVTLLSLPSEKRKRKLIFTLDVEGKKRKILKIFLSFQRQLILNQSNMSQR